MTSLDVDAPLTGANITAGRDRRDAADGFTAYYPSTGQPRGIRYAEATPVEVHAAVEAAGRAYASARMEPPSTFARLVRAVADNLEALGSRLIVAAAEESGLGVTRLEGERARTCAQLRAFAAIVEQGLHLDAMIDLPDPDAVPVPRPDVRRMLVPIGPVAVFGASNFPLAFGVPGGDTAAALAAGCPVVAKGHQCHPETSELCGRAVNAAVAEVGLPDGMFSLVQGGSNEVGANLVQEPGIAAVGFTGSEAGGRALFDIAAHRPVPIPVYAEMGSLNPVVLTAAAVETRGTGIAAGFVASLTLGWGQFCTNPGVVFVPDTAPGSSFIEQVADLVEGSGPGFLLSSQIQASLQRKVADTSQVPGVELTRGRPPAEAGFSHEAVVATLSAERLLANPSLMTEHFGPVSLLVRYRSREELLAALDALPGALTVTVHAEEQEHGDVSGLLPALVEKAGRVIWNGYPTGVSVTAAMHHGGPYPATTFPAHTSVGWTSIRRFLRPVAFQDVPDPVLPAALRNANPLGIPRHVNGTLSSEPLGVGTSATAARS